MRVHIEDWVPYWRVREGYVEVPDGLTGKELLDFLHENHVPLVLDLEPEERGICHEAPHRTAATLPDGTIITY